MTKRTATKLFAVVALATSTTACTAVSRTPRTSIFVEEIGPMRPILQPTATVEKPILEQVKTELTVSTPRLLKTGAPACGNTQSKAKREGC